MKALRQLVATVLLALTLSLSAYAGDVSGPVGGAAPAPGDMGGATSPAPGDMPGPTLASLIEIILGSIGGY